MLSILGFIGPFVCLSAFKTPQRPNAVDTARRSTPTARGLGTGHVSVAANSFVPQSTTGSTKACHSTTIALPFSSTGRLWFIFHSSSTNGPTFVSFSTHHLPPHFISHSPSTLPAHRNLFPATYHTVRLQHHRASTTPACRPCTPHSARATL